MGLFQAASGAISGTIADQYLDFYTVPDGLKPTAALFAALPRGVNAGRGGNTDASHNVITNGSKIVLPEGFALILMQDGAITGFAAEPGTYEWNSGAQDSKSVFSGQGLVEPLLRTSWERFKFGGRPHSQQRAFFVSLKELANNSFATQSEIYWDDAYLNAQFGANTRGSYTLKITDPILFVKNFVPVKYLQPGVVFDFTDLYNDAAEQLFNEVVSSLAQAFSIYTNDPSKGNRITRIQKDSVRFANSLSEAVEQSYHWKSERGLEIVSTATISIARREFPRTPKGRAARRCPLGCARQFEPAGIRPVWLAGGRRNRWRASGDRDGHGCRRYRARRTAAAAGATHSAGTRRRRPDGGADEVQAVARRGADHRGRLRGREGKSPGTLGRHDRVGSRGLSTRRGCEKRRVEAAVAARNGRLGHESNRLPAPADNFIVWLRVHLPGAAILDGTYEVPPVVEVK